MAGRAGAGPGEARPPGQGLMLGTGGGRPGNHVAWAAHYSVQVALEVMSKPEQGEPGGVWGQKV